MTTQIQKPFKVKKLKKGYSTELMVNGERFYLKAENLELLEFQVSKLKDQRVRIVKNDDKKFIKMPLKRLWLLYLDYANKKYKPSTIYLKTRAFDYLKPVWLKDVKDLSVEDIVKCWDSHAKKINKKELGSQEKQKVIVLLEQFASIIEVEELPTRLGVNLKKLRYKYCHYRQEDDYSKKQFYNKDEMNLLLKTLRDEDLPNKIYRQKRTVELFKKQQMAWYHFVRLGISCGARLGEMLALKKDDFNADTKKLNIKSTISVSVNGFIDSGKTKTGRSRLVPLGDKGMESFLFLKSIASTDYLSSSLRCEDNLPFTGVYRFRYVVGKLQEIAGLEKISSHKMMRKTFATLTWESQIKTNGNPRDVLHCIMEALGHKSEAVTWKYIRAIDESLVANVDVIFD